MLYFVNFFKLYFFTRFFIDGLPPSVIEAIKSYCVFIVIFLRFLLQAVMNELLSLHFYFHNK